MPSRPLDRRWSLDHPLTLSSLIVVIRAIPTVVGSYGERLVHALLLARATDTIESLI